MPAKGNTLQPCGTRAAYLRHLYHHQPPCDACTQANRYSRRRRKKGLPLRPLHHTSPTDLYPVIALLAELLLPGGAP